ncbi:MAG: hypothetical protein AAFX76_02485 [Planctomycetota bacterium]
MQTTKATISSGYRWRLVLITVLMLGFGVLCLKDGFVTYPAQVERYNTFRQLEADFPQTYPDEWKRVAAENGWDEKAPKKRTPQDVLTQFLMAGLVFPIGLFFLFKLVTETRRWVAMDGDGLTASGGHTVPWDRIERLNEARWKTKGIAWLHYRDDRGDERKVLLDDFKSQREPIQQIVREVQSRLNPVETSEDSAPAPGTEPQPEPASAG